MPLHAVTLSHSRCHPERCEGSPAACSDPEFRRRGFFAALRM